MANEDRFVFLNADVFNSTIDDFLDSVEEGASRGANRPQLSVFYQVLVSVLYGFGIIGNLAALGIISRTETARYKKQSLMLRCLVLNDLLALLGSFVLMHVHLYLPQADPKWLCVFRVIWRAFGLGSGCVSFVMALERWLALTHPFTYQKHVTQTVVRRSIIGLWSFNALLVCAPFFGFGLWYDETRLNKPCVRYRFGTSTLERAYAYLVFAFGISMCVCIVCCNMAVVRVLCRMGEKMITRRYSRASCRGSASQMDSAYNHATPEELSFARLMAILSIFFVICWCPQLFSIIAGQFSIISEGNHTYKAADFLIALNFTLDPFLYVLFRHGTHLVGRRATRGGKLGSRKNVYYHSRCQITGSSLSSQGHPKKRQEEEKDFIGGKPIVSSDVNSANSERDYVPLHQLLEPNTDNVPDKPIKATAFPWNSFNGAQTAKKSNSNN